MRHHHHAGSAIGAFIGGALIGGVIALLLAPRSGAETREMVREFVDEEFDTLKEGAASARDYVEGEIGRYKRKARRAVNDIEGMVEEVKDRAIGEIKKVARS